MPAFEGVGEQLQAFLKGGMQGGMLQALTIPTHLRPCGALGAAGGNEGLVGCIRQGGLSEGGLSCVRVKAGINQLHPTGV